jgi:quercetin dioxygenase-like cupin family protein
VKSITVGSLAIAATLLLAGFSNAFSQSQSNPPSPTPTSETDTDAKARPLLLERNEGELRTRRIHVDNSGTASSQFLLKVSPKNNGSEHLVAGTEEVAPGATLPKHRHLVQDEIVLVHSGTARVWLGDQERDLHAGGLVFIPANTWISAKNIGTEPVSITFIFSAPGFEDTMRCNSVAAGETPTQITPEQQRECAHLGHAENASRLDNPKK